MAKYILNILFITLSVFANSQSLAEKLGFSADDKLLIITVDEIGMCNSVNEAFIQSIQNPHINNASMMLPCPWIYEVAQFSKRNKKYSYGVHLTLMSEWKNKYNWTTVSDSVPSLINQSGVMWSEIVDVLEYANIEDVKKELDAQIQKAIKLGIPINFLSSQMGIMSYRQAYWEVYVSLAQKYNLPIRFISEPNFHGNNIDKRKAVLDSLGILHPDYLLWDEIDSLHYAKQFPYGLESVLENLKPGVTELFIKPSIYSPEIKSLSPQYQRRIEEYSWSVSDNIEKLIEKYNIKIINYKQLFELQQSNTN
jgi:chitin disaccharide deacetylase